MAIDLFSVRVWFHRAALPVLGAAVALALASPALPVTEQTFGRFEGVVLHGCYDGDTCTFTIPGVHPLLGDHIGVRIRGIDAPEIRGKCEAEKDLARKARDRLRGILGAAKRIDLADAARGKYFRIVADVDADGLRVSTLLFGEGLARSYNGMHARGSWCEMPSAPSQLGGAK